MQPSTIIVPPKSRVVAWVFMFWSVSNLGFGLWTYAEGILELGALVFMFAFSYGFLRVALDMSRRVELGAHNVTIATFLGRKTHRWSELRSVHFVGLPGARSVSAVLENTSFVVAERQQGLIEAGRLLEQVCVENGVVPQWGTAEQQARWWGSTSEERDKASSLPETSFKSVAVPAISRGVGRALIVGGLLTSVLATWSVWAQWRDPNDAIALGINMLIWMVWPSVALGRKLGKGLYLHQEGIVIVGVSGRAVERPWSQLTRVRFKGGSGSRHKMQLRVRGAKIGLSSQRAGFWDAARFIDDACGHAEKDARWALAPSEKGLTEVTPNYSGKGGRAAWWGSAPVTR